MKIHSQLEMLEYLLQFAHLEKLLTFLPGGSDVVNDATCARLFGIDEATYCHIKEQFVARTRQAARELLAQPAFAAQVDRLPIAVGETVVGFGSSSTDDSHSWFEILRQVFALRRPQDDIRFVNVGITNDTTTHLIARFSEVVKLQPDWIICYISSNDARRHGPSATKTLVSPEETEKNLLMLRHYGRLQTTAKWVWMTPTTLIEERITANPFLLANQALFRNEDAARIVDAILKQPDPTVNLWPLFGHPADPDLVLWDGVHPSIEGYKRIVGALVNYLGLSPK